MKSFSTHSAEETRDWGKVLAEEFLPGTLVTFQGDLGAGKTTLIQGILDEFGARRPFVSPTFIIMKQYELPSPSLQGIRRVYHADAYRVGEKDFEKLGFAEWVTDPEGLVLLEWPERIQNILPEKKIAITLHSLSETERKITLSSS